MRLRNLNGVLTVAAALWFCLYSQLALAQDDARPVDASILTAAQIAAAKAECDAAPAPDCLALLALEAYMAIDIEKRRGDGEGVAQIVMLQMGAGEVEAAGTG
jgi:hypothetical protein